MKVEQALEQVSKNLSNVALANEMRSKLSVTLPTFEKWLGKPVNGHLANALAKVLPEGYSVRIAPKDSVYESITFVDSNRRMIGIGYSWTGKVFDASMLDAIKSKLELWEIPTLEYFEFQYNEIVNKQKELNALIDNFNRKYITNFRESLGGRYL